MNESADERFTAADLALLSELRAGNDWMRSILSTLGRRGAAFRLNQPQRAQAWLSALATFPYYKAGQFLFDLLEWEDFMLDEPAGTIETTLDPQAMRRLSSMLRSLKAHLDGGIAVEAPAVLPDLVVRIEQPAEFPPLESGFYLYQDVVLGIVSAALPLASAQKPPQS